jgi:hypothetical protein
MFRKLGAKKGRTNFLLLIPLDSLEALDYPNIRDLLSMYIRDLLSMYIT